MKLLAKRTPYSSVVGGGLMLTDETGRARFMVIFTGTTEGIEKNENDALAEQFAKFIEQHGLVVPERSDHLPGAAQKETT